MALRFLGRQGPQDLSYRELSRLTNRFANVLKTLVVQRGERVFVLTGRIPALCTAVRGPTVMASLAADHRVSDGHRGARFLAELRELLQQPEAL